MADTPRKQTLALICGGQSTEHEISLLSAAGIYRAIDKERYEVLLIGVARDGQWFLHPDPERFLGEAGTRDVTEGEHILPIPGAALTLRPAAGGGVSHAPRASIDVVFPVIHGAGGEDGTLQGFLELLDVPYVGCSVLGSAVGMDKEVTKRLLNAAGVVVAPYVVLRSHEQWRGELKAITATLHFPLFVKPASLGSSVGVAKVSTYAELEAAILDAFRYDTKVLVEQAVRGREIEVAVLGNEKPEASLPGEVIPEDNFYSYRAKYIDEHGATLAMPAVLPDDAVSAVRVLACHVFQLLELAGMARVDFFFTPEGQWVVNEVNTVPGFTTISMYPKLWELSGVPFPELIDRLVVLALARRSAQRRLERRYTAAEKN